MSEKLLAKIQSLTEELQKTRAELEEAKRQLKAKEIELEAVRVQADEVSHTDALTYLPNRRQVINTLQTEVHRAERYRTPLSISMIDIDHFKAINDTFGHTVGDQVLRQLATLLREKIREPDMVGRYGGEEFLVILPNTRLNDAAEQAARLCKLVRTAEFDVGTKTHLTISIGAAEYRTGEETWQKFLSRADMALYEAKNKGRDQWAVSAAQAVAESQK
ncbi:MAG: GGDEF domain-containing protein [Chloroflexota bacterium]